MAKLFRVLNNNVRIRILKELAVKGNCSFSELNHVCNVSAGTLAYHLGVLKELVSKKENSYHLTEEGRCAYKIIKEVEDLASS